MTKSRDGYAITSGMEGGRKAGFGGKFFALSYEVKSEHKLGR